jgi:hypothetical protein
MSDWPIFHVMNFTDAQRGDPACVELWRGIYNEVKPKRAEVIEALLSVEGLLDQVLLDLFVGKDAMLRERLRELVLAAEFCGTHQKWKMLGMLMKSEPPYFASLDEQSAKELRADIKDLNDDRNKFAHGDLFVDARNNSVVLRYYESGTKYLVVNSTSVGSLLTRAARARERLWALHSKFGTDLCAAQLSV